MKSTIAAAASALPARTPAALAMLPYSRWLDYCAVGFFVHAAAGPVPVPLRVRQAAAPGYVPPAKSSLPQSKREAQFRNKVSSLKALQQKPVDNKPSPLGALGQLQRMSASMARWIAPLGGN